MLHSVSYSKVLCLECGLVYCVEENKSVGWKSEE